MCEERVEQVRNEYDNILQQKLSEQVIITALVSLTTYTHILFFSMMLSSSSSIIRSRRDSPSPRPPATCHNGKKKYQEDTFRS